VDDPSLLAIARRRMTELSAAKEAEAAAQLAVLDVREQAAKVAEAWRDEVTRLPCSMTDDEMSAWKSACEIVANRIRALPLPPTPTEEKVRRLVVATALALETPGMIKGRDSLQAALSEVEALIRTQEEK
jgi:hypothetical protein